MRAKKVGGEKKRMEKSLKDKSLKAKFCCQKHFFFPLSFISWENGKTF